MGCGCVGPTDIPSWLFWPACLPWDHQSDWTSTFFLKNDRITLSLLLSLKTSRWEAWCEEETAKRCDDYEYVQLQVPLCVCLSSLFCFGVGGGG